MDIDELIYKIYLKSLLPFEEIPRKEQVVFGNIKDDKRKIRKQVFSNKSYQSGFTKVHKNNFKSKRDIKILSNQSAESKDEFNIPEWLKTLKNVISNEELKDKIDGFDNLPFIEFFEPFLNYFIKKNFIKLDFIDFNIQKIILKAFYQQLFEISKSVLFYELKNMQNNFLINCVKKDKIYLEVINFLIDEKFNYIFNKYPLLAKKIAMKTNRFSEFVCNFFERFENDKNELLIFFQIEKLQIEKLEFESGDFHNGEATVLVFFKGNKKVIYKPRNISITNPYNSLINWINLKLKINLRTFKIIDKMDYGWIEFIYNKEIDSIDQIKNYYYLAGVLCGVTYFLNSRDFHEENVIATNNGPVLIDHEMIFGAKIKYNKGSSNEASIFESMLLPAIKEKHFKNGYGNSKRKDRSEFYIKIVHPNSYKMEQIPQIRNKIKEKKKNLPHYNSKPQNLKNYKANFISGFVKVYNLFKNEKSFLLSNNSPILYFKNKSIRHILRPTRVYVKLLKQLTKVDVLANPAKYELKLEQLSRAFLNNHSKFNLMELERNQLMCGDIPIFLSNTSSKTVSLETGKFVNIFENTAVENVISRVRNACEFDLEKQIENINLSFKEL